MLFKNKNINVTLSLSIALAAIVWSAIIPQKSSLYTSAESIKSEKNELTRLFNQGKNIKELRNQLERYKKDALKLQSIFLYQNNEIEFITALEKIAAKNDIGQTINLAEPQTSDTDLTTSAINLEITGNFKQIINYLEDLENLDYYVNLSQIQLLNGRENSDQNIPPLTAVDSQEIAVSQKLNARLDGQIYWQ